MMRFLFCLSLICFASCVGVDQPCDYDISEFKATVKDLVPYEEDGKQLIHVVLEFDKGSLSTSPQYLDALQNIEIDSAFIKRNHIRTGYIYRGTASIRTDGDCDPMVVSFDHNFQ